ncbi:MAG: hypothetical protein GX931_02320 [Acholeplasmataceae bacterium]|jgi:saccharopine dehydrogenase-like NADP-dependent oxidoreductase|nr:hypothetical protein [Acholeplasmataceae bacterium]
MKLLAIGGAGNMTRAALEKIVMDDYFSEVIIADYNLEGAKKVVKSIGKKNYRAEFIDVTDKELTRSLMDEADVVMNGAGPFYKLLEPTIDAFLESKCKYYVDICDDISAMDDVMTEENKKKAIENGQTIIIGLGGSPGIIPLEVMYAATLMDEVTDANFYMIMDELVEGGTAVWDHMYENFNGKVTIFEDGKLSEVEGLSRVEMYTFPEEVFPGAGTTEVYDLGHPEVFTLPQGLPNIKNIKIKCTIFPTPVMKLITIFNEHGFLNTAPIEVDGVKVNPRNVLLKLSESTQLNPNYKGGFHPSHRGPQEVVSGPVIEAHGFKDGKPCMYKSGFTTPMGPITGYPMAVGAKMLAKGEIKKVGMMIPEVAITDPGKLVNEVYDSIEASPHFLKRFAKIEYNLSSVQKKARE